MRDTRSRIVAEATRQLPRVGYAAFTVAAVRDALRLSSGSMFHAFPSKAALAAAVYVEGMTDYQHAATEALEAASDPADAIRAWVAVHLGWIEAHRELARYLFSTLPDEVAVAASAPLAERNRDFYAALTRLFTAAHAAGLAGHLPRPVAQTLCIGPAHEYGRLWARGAAEVAPSSLVTMFQGAALAALASTVDVTRLSRARRRKESRA